MERDKSTVETLIFLPWWISAALAVCAYFLIPSVLPLLFSGGSAMLTNGVNQTAPHLAKLFAFTLMGVSIISLLRSLIERYKQNRV